MKKKKRFDLERFIGGFVLFCFMVPIIFLIVRMIFPSETLPRITADYLLMLAQCILGVFACFIPSIVKKRFSLEIPSFMTVVYLLFLYCAIFLGEVRFFYITVKNWDTLLHTFSGVMIGTLGFSFVNILNDNKDDTHLKLSPFFVAFFAFCFSVMLGTLWEVYEFAADHLLGFNMQKFRLPDGTELIGHSALGDTMKDIIVDIVGAIFATTIGYISLKYKRGWIEKTFLKKNKAQKSQKNDSVKAENSDTSDNNS